MWHPNKAQWWVIWTMAVGFNLLALFNALDNRGGGGLFLVFVMDGVLLIWKLQRSAK